jgi:hypothetical protein
VSLAAASGGTTAAASLLLRARAERSKWVSPASTSSSQPTCFGQRGRGARQRPVRVCSGVG